MFGASFSKDTVENIFNAFGICDKIFKPTLTVNDLGISYRTINNWESNDLMLSERENNRNWHKFSFVDFVWLSIVFELRQLGFPLNKINKLKQFLNENIGEESLLAVKRTEARVLLNNKELNRLVLLLAEIMYNKNHIALLCNKEGSFYIYNEQMMRDEQLNFDPGKIQFSNYVSISLTDIIMKYLFTVKLELIQSTKILNEEFYELVCKLRNNEITNLHFHINRKESFEINCDLFENYNEFINACFRLILTLRVESIT